MGYSPVNLFGGQQQQRPAQPSFIETLLNSFMSGLQIAQTIRGANQESEARRQAIEQQSLQMELVKHQLNAAKLEEKMAPSRIQFELAKLLQGLPGQSVSSTANPSEIPVPGMANVPESLGGPGGYQPSGQTTNFGVQPASYQTQVPRPPVNIDLAGMLPGAGNVSIPIETQQQQFMRTLMQAAQEGRVAAGAAGAKAGAEAQAKAPFEQALEGIKTEGAMGLAQFNQGQENNRTRATIGKDLQVAGMNLAATQNQRGFEQTNQLLDDFRTDTKDFSTIDDAYAKIQAAAKGTGGGASDLALVYGYMKLLDPASSVREGEVASAQNTAGVPDWVRLQYNKMLSGERLAPAQRTNILTASTDAYKAVQPRLKQIEQRYQGRAKKNGIDTNLFKFQTNATGSGVAPEGSVVYDPSGKAFRITNGQPVPVQ